MINKIINSITNFATIARTLLQLESSTIELIVALLGLGFMVLMPAIGVNIATAITGLAVSGFMAAAIPFVGWQAILGGFIGIVVGACVIALAFIGYNYIFSEKKEDFAIGLAIVSFLGVMLIGTIVSTIIFFPILAAGMGCVIGIPVFMLIAIDVVRNLTNHFYTKNEEGAPTAEDDGISMSDENTVDPTPSEQLAPAGLQEEAGVDGLEGEDPNPEVVVLSLTVEIIDEDTDEFTI